MKVWIDTVEGDYVKACMVDNAPTHKVTYTYMNLGEKMLVLDNHHHVLAKGYDVVTNGVAK